MIKQKFLVFCASVIALTAVPALHPVMAQPAATSTPTGVTEILKQLNLTPDQQQRVDAIQADAAVKIKAVLTPDQVAQLKVMAEAGKGDADSFKNLNLTEDQKSKLNDIKMSLGLQLFPILTGEQQQKLMDAVMPKPKS
jgi:Spy/CpxP family protein refolding chaperone